MSRALGISAIAAFAFESTYGVAPGSGFVRLPFSPPSSLGASQGLIADDTLGEGFYVADPTKDNVDGKGKMTVGFDGRNIGYWLKLMFGAPTTVQVAAWDTVNFSAQPAATSTLTLNGSVWTFVASGATGNQVNIGANLAATLTALKTALNASADTQTAKCTYDVTATSLSIVNDTVGTSGNTFTVAASANSNGVPITPTLTGGGYQHTFISGNATLPSASIEIGNPEIPSYRMNVGVEANIFTLAPSPSGNLNAVIDLITQNEQPSTSATAAGTPTVLKMTRFANPAGAVLVDGASVGVVTSAEFSYNNNRESVRGIRADSLIDGTDRGKPSCGLKVSLRFQSTAMLNKATSLTPVAITMPWTNADGHMITITAHRVFLPRPEIPMNGPGGIQLDFDGQAVTDPTAGKICTIVLLNDQPNYN